MTKGKEHTPLPFCFTCNKVLTIDTVLLHIEHRTGKQSFMDIYNEAVSNVESKEKDIKRGKRNRNRMR